MNVKPEPHKPGSHPELQTRDSRHLCIHCTRMSCRCSDVTELTLPSSRAASAPKSLVSVHYLFSCPSFGVTLNSPLLSETPTSQLPPLTTYQSSATCFLYTWSNPFNIVLRNYRVFEPEGSGGFSWASSLLVVP